MIYKINTVSKREFCEVFDKLISLGFVYSDGRYRDIKDVIKMWPGVWNTYPVMVLGADRERKNACKMVIHGDTPINNYWGNIDYQYVTLEGFLRDIFPTW